MQTSYLKKPVGKIKTLFYMAMCLNYLIKMFSKP